MVNASLLPEPLDKKLLLHFAVVRVLLHALPHVLLVALERLLHLQQSFFPLAFIYRAVQLFEELVERYVARGGFEFIDDRGQFSFCERSLLFYEPVYEFIAFYSSAYGV